MMIELTIKTSRRSYLVPKSPTGATKAGRDPTRFPRRCLRPMQPCRPGWFLQPGRDIRARNRRQPDFAGHCAVVNVLARCFEELEAKVDMATVAAGGAMAPLAEVQRSVAGQECEASAVPGLADSGGPHCSDEHARTLRFNCRP
jgi:hypothetical protein